MTYELLKDFKYPVQMAFEEWFDREKAPLLRDSPQYFVIRECMREGFYAAYDINFSKG
jgi:hypothetical protein